MRPTDWAPEPGWQISVSYLVRSDSAADWESLGSGTNRLRLTILGTRVCGTTSVSDTSAAVSIPDDALRRVIEAALGKSAGDAISYAELATIEEIEAENSGITSMEGLQYAFGLRFLNG